MGSRPPRRFYPEPAAELTYDTIGESVGFLRFDQTGARRLAALVADYVARDCAHMPHEEAVRDLLRERSQIFEVAAVTGAPWIEINFPTDVIRAAHEVLPQLLGHWRGVNDLEDFRQAVDFAHAQTPFGSAPGAEPAESAVD